MRIKEKDFGEVGSVFSPGYWREAARQVRSVRMLAFAAIIIALRVAVKPLAIPIAADIRMTLDCYVNALGSMIYGPTMALLVGAISDTIGAIVFPTGTYFLPFILVEMTSGFLFALFFWHRKLTAPRAILAKFTVNLICNIVMNSVFMKWYYIFFGMESAETYAIINGVRIVKNLVLFPAEAMLIVVILNALIPALRSLKVLPPETKAMPMTWPNIQLTCLFVFLSVDIILFYVFFFKDYMSLHNFKFWI